MSCWFFHHHLSMLKHKPLSVSKTLLALSPKRDSEVDRFPLPSTLTAVRTSAPFYIPSARRQDWISPGCRMGSSEDSSTRFAAKPFPTPTAVQTPATATHLKQQPAVPALHPCYFLAPLQLVTNATKHSGYVASWVVGICPVLPTLLTQLAKLPPDISGLC